MAQMRAGHEPRLAFMKIGTEICVCEEAEPQRWIRAWDPLSRIGNERCY